MDDASPTARLVLRPLTDTGLTGMGLTGMGGYSVTSPPPAEELQRAIGFGVRVRASQPHAVACPIDRRHDLWRYDLDGLGALAALRVANVVAHYLRRSGHPHAPAMAMEVLVQLPGGSTLARVEVSADPR